MGRIESGFTGAPYGDPGFRGDGSGFSNEDEVVNRIVRDYLLSTIGENYEERILERMVELCIISVAELGNFQFSAENLKRHPRSKALYLIDEKYNSADDLVYLSVLVPRTQTSPHYHNPPISEIYHPLEGELHLRSRPLQSQFVEDEVIQKGRVRIVYPREAHQAETKDQFALTAIQMKGTRGIPSDRLHVRLADINSNT